MLLLNAIAIIIAFKKDTFQEEIQDFHYSRSYYKRTGRDEFQQGQELLLDKRECMKRYLESFLIILQPAF